MSEPIEQVKTAFDSLLNNISKPRRRLMYQQIGRELAEANADGLKHNKTQTARHTSHAKSRRKG